MHSVPITYSSHIVLNLSAFPSISLYTDGFTTSSFNLRSFHELEGDLFQDYQNCVFRIIPVLNYKAHDSLLEQLNQDDFQQIQMERVLKKRKQLIQSLQLNLENELSSNISLTNKLAGTPLVFSSSTFHLVHMSSLKFLALDDENLEDLEFKLLDFPNDNTVLKFNPCLNFQKLRTNVVYEGDVVCVSAIKQVCNRTANLYSSYWGLHYAQTAGGQNQNYKENRDRYLNEIKESKVQASVEEQTQFRINIFQTQKKNDDILYIGDVVIMNLPEQNKYLNGKRTKDLFEKVLSLLDGPQDNQLAESKPMFLKQSTLFPTAMLPLSYSRQPSEEVKNDSNVKSESLEKQKSMQSKQSRQSIMLRTSTDVLEIEKLLSSEIILQFDDQTISMPYSAYWRIEAEDKIGGECVWDKYYRIRHFQTGKYLEINSMRQVRLTNEVKKSTLFKFITVTKSKQTKYVTKDSYFQLKHKESGCFIDFQNQQLVSIIEQKNENIFKIRKADYEDVWEKRFLLFFVPLLTKAITYFELAKTQNITLLKIDDIKERCEFYHLHERLSQMLDIMNQFIYNKLSSNIQTTQDYSFISKSRQDIIREEGVMPLLIWLLIKSYPQSYEQINKSKADLQADLAGERSFITRVEAQMQQQKQSMAQLQKLEDNHRKRKLLLSIQLYETLKSICHNNSVNQEIFIRYFHHFEKNLTRDYVCCTLSNTITRNYSILNSLKITNKLQQFVQLILENQTPELMELLAGCCNAGDLPIFTNQEYLLKSVIQDERASSKILMPLTIEQQGSYFELHISYKNSEGHYVRKQLLDFLNEDFQNPLYHQQYLYLKQQLSFKANLCFHRNTQAREILSQKYTYSLLLTYALDDGVDDGIRAQFCRMIRTMYIDREPYTTTPKPELVRILDPIITETQLFLYEEINYEKEEQNYDLQSLKTKLLNYIENVCQMLKDCKNTDKVYTLLTLEVIKILELLLKFQLFQQSNIGLASKKNSRKTYFLNDKTMHQSEDGKINEIDKLIKYLAQMLEFDYSYFTCLQEYKIERAYEVDETETAGLLNFTNFSSVFTEKREEIPKIKQKVKSQEAEVVNDPLFKKMKSLRKVIQKYINKTFTLRENKEDDYETLIKIQICSIFSYLMDLSQDYWIDNVLTYVKNTTTDYQYATLFPNDILSSGEKYKQIERIYHTTPPQLKSFDEVLKRPFIEVLLIALYFTRNPQLENQIVELIQRFARQKKEFCLHFQNVQILDQTEQQQLYNVWIMIITNLKNNVQRSQTWITNQNCQIMDQTLQELWKIDSIFKQNENVSLKLKQQIFEHIGGYGVLVELIDKGISVIDQGVSTPKLDQVLNYSLNIMAYYSKDNETNQLLIYKRVAQKVLNYTNNNIGQVELISSLFSGKPTLFGQLGQQEYELFIILIKEHGQYPEFLSFYEEILNVSEEYSKDNSDMHAIVLECLTNQECFEFLNPFKTQKIGTFFTFLPNFEKYRINFLKLLSKCLNKVSNASLISQTILCLDLNELLNYIEKLSKHNYQMIMQRENQNMIGILRHSWFLVKIMIEHSQTALEFLIKGEHCFFDILKIELNGISLQKNFDSSNLDYLFDSLLPIVNKYNGMLQNALMSSYEQEHKMYKFVEFFLQNLDKMFFMAPNELIKNAKRMQTINELATSFNIDLKEHLRFQQDHHQKEQTEIQIKQQPSIQIEQQSSIKKFRTLFMENDEIKQLVKQESSYLSKSIWNIQRMFKEQNSQQKDLLLTNEDIIIKFLAYLQFWKPNGASRDNVIFILKVLSAILKDADAKDDEELMERQNLFNRMHAPQIIIVLLCESDFEPLYMSTLTKFTILLLKNGNLNVQKTIYEYFLSNTHCEQLFYQIKKIFNMQIQSHDSAHKLNALENKLVCNILKTLQLFCEGHNPDLQNYLRNQHNQKNSQDLVTLTVSLLQSFSICTANYESVLQCFETLTEMIQGPCKLNQQALIKSNLVEIAVQVLNENEKYFELSTEFKRISKNNEVYRLNLHPGNLARLKYKCLNTIVSLLECSEPQDNDIMRIVRSIPLNVLTQNLSKIYALFKKQSDGIYKDELFSRAEMDLQDDEFDELVIENGFHIYLLMQQFLGNLKAKELLYEDSEMNDVLDVFNPQEQNSNPIAGLFSNIGNLAKLGGEFFNKGINLIQEKLNQTPEQIKQEQLLKEKQEQKELTKNAAKFFRENTCSIDMVRDDRLYTIFFPRLPICRLPKNAKIEFHDQVDRTSSKTKLTTLIDSAPHLIKIMEYEERLNQLFAVNPVFGFFATQGKLWEQCAFLTTLVINFIVACSYSQYFYNGENDLTNERLYDPRFMFISQFTWTSYVIQVLGILMLVFSSLIVFFFLVKRAPLKVDDIWNGYVMPKKFSKFLLDFIIRSLMSIFILMKDVDILYYSIYIIAGIVGLTVHPFFFAFHLMDFMKLDQLKTVMQAIWNPRVEILLALVLLTITEYYVGIISYIAFFQDYPIVNENSCQFEIETPTENYVICERACSTLWQCVTISFDLTFKYTGALGAALEDFDTVKLLSQNYDTITQPFTRIQLAQGDFNGTDHLYTSNYINRFIFDNVVNIILVMILLNMLQGIIIDTFGSLREQQQERIRDQTMKCYICGITREKFEKNDGGGFSEHIVMEHYMWNYVYYYAYLIHKDENDYNGNESYIREKIEAKDISWLPIKRARFADEEKDDSNKTQEIEEELYNQMKSINEKIHKLSGRANAVVDQLKQNNIMQTVYKK